MTWWIKVSKRLPPVATDCHYDSEFVLIAGYDNKQTPFMTVALYDHHNGRWMEAYNSLDDATPIYWRPLPRFPGELEVTREAQEVPTT